MADIDNWDGVEMHHRGGHNPDEEFDKYFSQYNEIDDLFNETLTGLQDLDVPSGFVTTDLKQNTLRNGSPKHSRKTSGTAIFGFGDHTRELSLNSLNNDLLRSMKQMPESAKSISPGELSRVLSEQHCKQRDGVGMVHNDGGSVNSKPVLLLEEDEMAANEYQNYQNINSGNSKKEEDFIVPNRNFKFPSSPSPEKRYENKGAKYQKVQLENGDMPSYNSYTAKYLQEIKQNNSKLNVDYVDDIEPLLSSLNNQKEVNGAASSENVAGLYTGMDHMADSMNKESASNGYKYIPIPVQQPVLFTKPDISQGMAPQRYSLRNDCNAFLPPPSPPSMSHGSPDFHSSPEPQSPSPTRSFFDEISPAKFSSPVNQRRGEKMNFYNPQFFSDANNLVESENDFMVATGTSSNLAYSQSSPGYQRSTIGSSPVKTFTSPLRNMTNGMDDSVDANATIAQLTPLKNSFPSTPSKSSLKLEWSPIISPNEKGSKDVKKHIQQSSPARKVMKTSLLPPGELDRFWEGPNEEKNFTCTYKNCGKVFTRRYNVRSHIQTHLSDRPFGCSFCPKKFVRQHDLNRHVKGHLETRYCKCPCGKEFARLDAMKKHRERNICVGGVSSSHESSVTKPSKKRGSLLDELNAEKMNEKINDNILTSMS